MEAQVAWAGCKASSGPAAEVSRCGPGARWGLGPPKKGKKSLVIRTRVGVGVKMRGRYMIE